jgi:RNA polymerase sigma factor (sigma-70 family)
MHQELLSATEMKRYIDTLPETFLITDARGVVQYTNHHAATTSGFARAEIIGKNPGKLWGGHMDGAYYARLWNTIFHERMPFTALVQNTKKNGELFLEQMYLVPVVASINTTIAFYLKMRPPSENTITNLLSQWSAPTTLLGFLQTILITPTQELLRARHDDALLIAAAQNDSGSFDALYQKYYYEIFQYFFHHTHFDHELSADLAQETFIQAYRNLPQFTISNASYGTYLHTIAHRTLAAHYRAHKAILHETIASVEQLPATESTAADVFDIARMKQILLELSPIEQQILTMKYEKSLSVHEIAERLLKSENAIKLHLSRAREKMRQKFLTL